MQPLTQPIPDNFLPGYGKILELQLAYAPFIDSVSGKPLANPVQAQQSVSTSFMAAPMGQPQQSSVVNRNCEFEFVVYENSGSSKQPKPSHISQRRWEKIAETDNPDPEKYEAKLLYGIDSLKSQFENQNKNSQKLQDYVDTTIAGTLETLEESCKSITTRIEILKRNQDKVFVRFLDILRKVEVLRCHGCDLRNSESRFRERLEQILQVLSRQHVKLVDVMNSEANLTQFAGAAGRDEATSVSDDEIVGEERDSMLLAIFHALQQQRQGLGELSETLRKDVRDVGIMEKRIGL